MTLYIDAGNGRKNWRMLFVSFNRTWKQNVTTILRILCQKPSKYIIIIIVMVHVVKGCQYSTSHIDAGASIAEMESEIDSQSQ